jgi:diadenosine tetraphosphate (Ap4A) HIT family hydrolase
VTDCKFCAKLKAQAARAPWNEFLIETENFAVVPSLGALVEGWLLMVPKEHYISMGALPPRLRDEADSIESQIRALLAGQYEKPVVVFEHGPSAAKHGTGCGVDHAHLHLLPLDCDLLSLAEPFVPKSLPWKESGWEERSNAYRAGLDYLYLKTDERGGLLAVSEDFGSQVFRKAISSYLGVPEEFSWRDHPRISTVTRTIEALGGVLGLNGSRGAGYAA